MSDCKCCSTLSFQAIFVTYSLRQAQLCTKHELAVGWAQATLGRPNINFDPSVIFSPGMINSLLVSETKTRSMVPIIAYKSNFFNSGLNRLQMRTWRRLINSMTTPGTLINNMTDNACTDFSKYVNGQLRYAIRSFKVQFLSFLATSQPKAYSLRLFVKTAAILQRQTCSFAVYMRRTCSFERMVAGYIHMSLPGIIWPIPPTTGVWAYIWILGYTIPFG